ncbi:MAG: hypothetical protein KF886_09680 [Candidatus Hydrogenedentes bacterium]|nr:hypothetical protein [Candidatus Hydrogenedentota bacterium]
MRLSAYCTAHDAQRLLDPEQQQRALGILRDLSVERVIVETNRGDQAVAEADLRTLRDFFEGEGFEVMGGIATVPGENWGVAANEGLAWLNFEHPKTQADLEAAMRAAARVFDAYVVDDFLLSGDRSAISDAARRGRDWPEYRRDLTTAISQRIFIDAAKEENPDIRMILKFPQSYDRYHVFGYDVERHPQLYDAVWVGTETRGQYTQRFGFTQPYEGFVNYRWIDSLSGGKLEAAWFDHGDCDGPDFVEQAWQTVLAGARDIVLFSYAALADSHPGHELLRQDLAGLRALAEAVRAAPVTGVAGYKPPNSDPVSDMYIMDFIGMLGIPVVPVSEFPHASKRIFAPAYGARDPEIANHIEAALHGGKTVIVTTGLLANAVEGDRLAKLAGLAEAPAVAHLRTESVLVDGAAVHVPRGLDVGGRIAPQAAEVLLEALDGDTPVPFLTEHHVGSGRLLVLNLHMFTQEDFDAVNEVLLSPRNLGLLDLPEAWASVLRDRFGGGGERLVLAPTRVTIQPLGESGWFIQNYNNTPATVRLDVSGLPAGSLRDGFTGGAIEASGHVIERTMPARSRWWVAR